MQRVFTPVALTDNGFSIPGSESGVYPPGWCRCTRLSLCPCVGDENQTICKGVVYVGTAPWRENLWVSSDELWALLMYLDPVG